MRKLKIFPKTFIYTFIMMLFITILANGLVYFLAPKMNLTATPSGITGNTLNAAINKSQIIANAISSALPYSIIFCIIISFICSLFFSRTFTTPIKIITSATVKMAQLDKSAHSNIQSEDEIGVLSENINQLYNNLLSAIENLVEEKEKVREAESSKADFLRAASHELKTPLTAINVMLENMILGIGKYKNHDEYLPKCKDMTAQLFDMIRDILDTSKLSTSIQIEESADTDIGDMMADLCSAYQMIAKSNGVDFKLDLSNSFTTTVKSKLLKKAISNVLSNAVSYTDEGKAVSVYFNDTAIYIENECTPIPQEALPYIFEPFYRPEFSRNRNLGGNGLGLYLTATILSAININYQFKPMENLQGMRFIVYL